MTPDAQRAAFDRWVLEAYDFADLLLATRRDRIIELARARFEAGIDRIGDRMFHTDPLVLEGEIEEEAADLIAWSVGYLHQTEKGD